MKGKKGKENSFWKVAKAKPKNAEKSVSDPKFETEMPPVMGGKARMRLDRPGRKLGGRVGADTAPMSSAAKKC